ncbi:hypothetical protein WJX81_005291 [Elliptochloris bilobata]|uniref:MAGE domain-containing protein n=1 Tax=Elliptochloris bilobata TaxID=381761 RepID=A0AAW1QN23_9CHLO
MASPYPTRTRGPRLDPAMDNTNDAEAPAPKRARRAAAPAEGEAGPSGSGPVRRPGATAGGRGRAARNWEVNEEEEDHMEQVTDHYRREEVKSREKLGVTEQEAEQLVAGVMRYMLFRQAQKPDQPVRREDIARQAMGKYQGMRMAGPIIARAQEKFAAEFGLEMKQMELHQAAMKSSKLTGSFNVTVAYVLRSILPTALLAFAYPNPEPLYALAIIIMSVIHLSGDSVSEVELWQQLEDLGLQKAGRQKAFKGTAQEQLQLLVKQRYLVEVTQGRGAEVERTYELGDNGSTAMNDERIKDFIKQVFDAPQEA